MQAVFETFEESEKEQIRRWAKMTPKELLENLEKMQMEFPLSENYLDPDDIGKKFIVLEKKNNK